MARVWTTPDPNLPSPAPPLPPTSTSPIPTQPTPSQVEAEVVEAGGEGRRGCRAWVWGRRHCGAVAVGTGVVRALVAADRTGDPVRGPRAVEAGKAEIPERRETDEVRTATTCIMNTFKKKKNRPL